VGVLVLGLAVAVAGCSAADQNSSGARPVGQGRAPGFPRVPAPHPALSQTITHGLGGAGRICLTVDDGDCADCVGGYVEFAQRSGIHLTFSPNGVYASCWSPHAGTLKPLIERGQVQIMNHTFSHRDLRRMTEAQITTELERNDDWVVKTFGVTTRPYYRPPFGFHNSHIDGVAAGLGYTRTVMGDGSYADSDPITPEVLIGMAQQYLHPGVIMLGHANHPTVLGCFDQIQALIKQRNLSPVTLDEMFGTSRATG